jgi:hypothetical protein
VDASGTPPPAVGDRITETINGAAKTFEVQTPENGEPAWRYDTRTARDVPAPLKAV